MCMFKPNNNAPNTVSIATQESPRFVSPCHVIATTPILSLVSLPQPIAEQQGVIWSADKLLGEFCSRSVIDQDTTVSSKTSSSRKGVVYGDA